MAFMLLLFAMWPGADAATKLSKPHPLAAAYFEAAICGLLIIGAVVLLALGRGDD